jgi:hypothetical protein
MAFHRILPAKSRVSVVLPWLYLLILACINIYICREAFVTDSIGHWNSIHGQWISLARIAGLDWLKPTWWPYWGGGAPLEFTYAPLIPAAMAVMVRLFHCSPEAALNVLTGLAQIQARALGDGPGDHVHAGRKRMVGEQLELVGVAWIRER